MIVYSNSCLACTNKPLWRQLRQYAHRNRLKLEERRTDTDLAYREETNHYSLHEPFVVIDGKSYKPDDLPEVSTTTN